MTTFFDHMRVTHVDQLSDLNTCTAEVNNATRHWMGVIQEWVIMPGMTPGVSAYNVAIDTLRLHTSNMWKELNKAEKAFLISKSGHDTRVKEHEALAKTELRNRIRDAIQKFLSGCVMSFLKYMGCQGNLDPWLTQVSVKAMEFQSRVLAQTLEYSDLPMELCSAAVMQKLEMFIATARMLPITCPLSYPVPAQHSRALAPSAPIEDPKKMDSSKLAAAKTRGSTPAPSPQQAPATHSVAKRHAAGSSHDPSCQASYPVPAKMVTLSTTLKATSAISGASGTSFRPKGSSTLRVPILDMLGGGVQLHYHAGSRPWTKVYRFTPRSESSYKVWPHHATSAHMSGGHPTCTSIGTDRHPIHLYHHHSSCDSLRYRWHHLIEVYNHITQ